LVAHPLTFTENFYGICRQLNVRPASRKTTPDCSKTGWTSIHSLWDQTVLRQPHFFLVLWQTPVGDCEWLLS